VLDEWFEHAVVPQLTGHARLIRYADDFVAGFEHKQDAEHVLEMLRQRMEEYGLTLHPNKTRLVRFERPRQGPPSEPGPQTFDFLGFTLLWQRGRTGRWRIGMKTRKARFRRALLALNDWCRRHRHESLSEQHAALSRRLNGHYNYFGVNGNSASLAALLHWATRLWLKWLRRRSQRARRLTWERFGQYLKAFPLPSPSIRVQIWAPSP
jgi:hypothetical protein